MSTCQGCGTPIQQPPHGGRRRKWCSERCRKNTLYTGTCVDCGERTGYSGTSVPSERCVPCASKISGAARKVWTRSAILAAIREWAAEYGEPPAGADWRPAAARCLNDELRARRFEEANGRWPSTSSVIAAFGTWNRALSEAGYSLREARSTPENAARQRRMRVAA